MEKQYLVVFDNLYTFIKQSRLILFSRLFHEHITGGERQYATFIQDKDRNVQKLHFR